MNISLSFGLQPEKVNERGNRRPFEYLPPGMKRQTREPAEPQCLAR